MKLLQENQELHAEEFSNASPYVIMFGPDKCGNTNKVRNHLIHGNMVIRMLTRVRFTSSSSTRTRLLASTRRST